MCDFTCNGFRGAGSYSVAGQLTGSVRVPNKSLQSTFGFSCAGARCGLVRRSVRRSCSGAKPNATELGSLGTST